MNTIVIQEIISGALRRIKVTAMHGTYTGRLSNYFESCKWYIEKYQCIIIFTRDVGHHTCGWWKNPDYERCWHLSISFPGGRKKSVLNKIIDSLFGSNKNKIWIEPPYSEVGKAREVWHYRLFCDSNWQPIIPRGEVYSTKFTELGWKSYSEVQANN